MGPAEKIPPLPKFAWTQAPQAHRHVTKVIEECNWLQALEGGIDTSHAPILHRAADRQQHARRDQAVQSVRRAARRRSWSSISPTMATSMPASVRSTAPMHAYPHLSLHPAVPSDPAVEDGKRTAISTPATSGCRSMTSNCMVYNWSLLSATAR